MKLWKALIDVMLALLVMLIFNTICFLFLYLLSNYFMYLIPTLLFLIVFFISLFLVRAWRDGRL